jgi:hypothetical protein
MEAESRLASPSSKKASLISFSRSNYSIGLLVIDRTAFKLSAYLVWATATCMTAIKKKRFIIFFINKLINPETTEHSKE